MAKSALYALQTACASEYVYLLLATLKTCLLDGAGELPVVVQVDDAVFAVDVILLVCAVGAKDVVDGDAFVANGLPYVLGAGLVVDPLKMEDSVFPIEVKNPEDDDAGDGDEDAGVP